MRGPPGEGKKGSCGRLAAFGCATGLVLAVASFTYVLTRDPVESGLTLLIRAGLLGEDGDSILGDRSDEELEQLLGHRDGFIRSVAATRLEASQGMAPFFRSIRSANPFARQISAQRLGWVSSDEARAALREACGDDDSFVSRRAFFALGNVGWDERDAEVLAASPLLNDSMFGDGAREVLERVRARTEPPDVGPMPRVGPP